MGYNKKEQMRCAIREREKEKKDSISNSSVRVQASARMSECIDQLTYTPETHSVRAAAYTQ
jgi:hypothetical protein